MQGLRIGCLMMYLCLSGVTVIAEEVAALRQGDRIAMLGGTLIEREQQSGYWETLMTVAAADRKVTFRNLGWSGDTVWGESRGLFEPHEGYDRLLEQVQAADPTLVLVAYGNNEAFAGEAGVEAFATQYKKLIGDLRADGRRFALVSPLYLEDDRLPHDPDAPADHALDYNRNVDLYAAAIHDIADDGRHAFIDLRPRQQAYLTEDHPPLTSNGLHMTEAGYRVSAPWLAEHFSALDEIEGFDFESPSASALREAIIAKNQLFFHRWRPQNFTYLFGFRKHEQGQNAVEVPQFDPLIEAAEREIAELAKSAAR